MIRIYYIPPAHEAEFPDLEGLAPWEAPAARLPFTGEQVDFTRGTPSRLRLDQVGAPGRLARNQRDALTLSEAWQQLAARAPGLASSTGAWHDATTALDAAGQPDLGVLSQAREGLKRWGIAQRDPRAKQAAARVDGQLARMLRRNAPALYGHEEPPTPRGTGPLFAPSPARLCREGWRLWGLGDREGARAFLEAAARKAPDDAGVNGQLGTLLREEGYYTRALTTLLHAETLAPQHAAPQLALGRLYCDMHEPTMALERFSRANRLSPARSDWRAEWGIALYEAGRLEEAERQLDQAVALDPKNAPARFYLAQIALQRHDVLRARYQLGLVAQLQPELDLSRFTEIDPAALGAPHAAGERQWRLPGGKQPGR